MEPALLGDAEASQQDAKAATPDALQVFARTLGYVWRPSFKERALLVVSIALLVLAKSLNLHVPFALAKSIKRWSISFLLFGCAAMVIAYVIAALIGMPDWLGEVKDELEHSELTCVPKPPPPPPPPHTLC